MDRGKVQVAVQLAFTLKYLCIILRNITFVKVDQGLPESV